MTTTTKPNVRTSAPESMRAAEKHREIANKHESRAKNLNARASWTPFACDKKKSARPEANSTDLLRMLSLIATFVRNPHRSYSLRDLIDYTKTRVYENHRPVSRLRNDLNQLEDAGIIQTAVRPLPEGKNPTNTDYRYTTKVRNLGELGAAMANLSHLHTMTKSTDMKETTQPPATLF